MTRAAERRLLAALTATALPADAGPAIPRGLAEADALAARGDALQSLQAITRTYDAGVKAFGPVRANGVPARSAQPPLPKVGHQGEQREGNAL